MRRTAILHLLLIMIVLSSAAPLARAQTTAPPAPPAVRVDTTPPPFTGTVRRVRAGDDLQVAINAARPGDRIELEAGATWTGNFYLRDKQQLTITTSDPCSIPGDGQQLNGPAADARLPKILTPNNQPVLDLWMLHEPDTHVPTNNIRFVGIKIGVAPGVSRVTTLVKAGGTNWQTTPDVQPHHVVFDRVYATSSPTCDLRRAFTLNGAHMAVINSWVDECHEVGADSQCILAFNGSGPYKFCNNELQGAGENIMFGGADSKSPLLVPSDIEVCHNHFYKPLRWRRADPSYAGRPWSVKNLLEFKSARRVLVSQNVFENCWVDGQVGYAIVITPRNQDGGAPWSIVEDIDFRDNVIAHAGTGFQMLGSDYNFPSGRLARVRIKNNLLYDIDAVRWGGSYGAFIVSIDGPRDVGIDHNTVIQSRHVLIFDGTRARAEGWSYTNNITAPGEYGVFSSLGEGSRTLDHYAPGIVLAGNVLTGRPATAYSGHASNFFPATVDEVGFVDFAGGDYRLRASSPYIGAGRQF